MGQRHPGQVHRGGRQNQAFWGQGQNLRFDELSYERNFLGDRLDFKGGFYSLGNDFGGLSYVCNFDNNGDCGHPLGLLYGSGWLNSPTGAWGGRLKWKARSGWYVQGGIYDVTPARKQHSNGFDLGFSRTTGVITPIEVGYVRGKTPADYTGVYKVGFYYDSSRTPDLGDPTRLAHDRIGGYVQAAQQIWKWRPGRMQGLSVFGVATFSDPITGLFSSTYEAGASLRGAFGRDDDIVSLSWIRLNVNGRVRDAERRAGKPVQSDEQLVELKETTGWQAEPWLLVRPSIQYVVRPGALDTRPDTVVFAAHVQQNFSRDTTAPTTPSSNGFRPVRMLASTARRSLGRRRHQWRPAMKILMVLTSHDILGDTGRKPDSGSRSSPLPTTCSPTPEPRSPWLRPRAVRRRSIPGATIPTIRPRR